MSEPMVLVEEKVGIVSLKKFLGFLIEILVSLVKILEDGKFGLGDALRLMSLLKSGVAAFKEVAHLKEEIADLSEAEKAELEKFVADKLDIKSEAIKGYVQQGLQFLLSLLDLYGVFKKKA